MRYLIAALAIVACAPEDSAPGYTGTADASVVMCPLVGTEGVSGAYGLPDGACAYRCEPTHRICGAVIDPTTLDVTDYGECRAYNDPRNCGRCGDVCGTDEVCRTLQTGGEFLCVPRGAR